MSRVSLEGFHVSRILARIAPLLFVAALSSCAGCSLGVLGGSRRSVTLLSYNVENLFDDVHNGTEYKEFDPAEGQWTTELFHIKMQHIAEVLRSAVRGGADIVALEEVENGNAAKTLNDTYLKGMGYRVFAGEPGKTSVTVCLLSRLPVTELRFHHLVSPDSEALRDIMEARIDCSGRPLVLFVNHWKSKLGGAASTEEGRRAASRLLVRRIRAAAQERSNTAFVIAGDLNESWDEYTKIGGNYPTALLPDSAKPSAAKPIDLLCVADAPSKAGISSDRVVFYSPWAESGSGGSYYYGGEWETIDHTLIGPRLSDGTGLEFESFEVARPAFLLTEKGYPLGWNSRRASGYSDHLPVLLTLSIRS